MHVALERIKLVADVGVVGGIKLAVERIKFVADVTVEGIKLVADLTS